MLLFSLPPLRRHAFEFFYRTHVVLFLVSGFAALAHGAGGALAGGALFGVDLVIRYIYRAGMRCPKTAEITALPADVVRVRWKKGWFNYKPGQVGRGV